MSYQAQAHGGGFIPENISPVDGHSSATTGHGGGFVPGQLQPQQYAQYPPQNPQPLAPMYYAPNGAQPGVQNQQGNYHVNNPSVPRQRISPDSEKGNHAVVAASVVPDHDANDLAEYNDKRGIVRPMKVRGSARDMIFRWFVLPHTVQRSGFMYDPNKTCRHQDSMGRIYNGPDDDRYISPKDAKIKTLVVQTVHDILRNPGNGTWKRTKIRNITPFLYRLALWPYSHIDMRESNVHTGEDWALLVGKWFASSLALTVLIAFTGDVSGEIRNNGAFDPFPYEYHGYPKVSRNSIEDDPSIRKAVGRKELDLHPTTNRLLRPRHLCFLKEPHSTEMCGWYPEFVEEWIRGHRTEKKLEYIFVAYTAEQFRSAEDLTALHQIAERAARNAGVPAYWVGCTCMPEQDKLQEDVYRISDVIRGASQLVIAIGMPAKNSTIATTDDMLRQWGSRVWTFPEILLAPTNSVLVYCRGNETNPFTVEKNQFAAKVWNDSDVSRQLLDHYLGNLILSRLELVTIALECLNSRETPEYLEGDHAYALMGLLRVRPTIDRGDSSFQAFARLSLGNDSDRLLERLICTLPVGDSQDWHTMNDAYGSKLWDIEPSVQISGIGDDDTVIIDGARAANVRWKSFARVAQARRSSFKRGMARTLLHSSGVVWYISIALLSLSAMGGSSESFDPETGGFTSSSSSSNPTFLIPGILLFLYSSVLLFSSPHLLRILYGGKIWASQSWFFGFEGYLSIETIESEIFGAGLGRMKWSAQGSPLSRHRKNQYGECVGIDPTSDQSVRDLVEQAKNSRPGEQKIFTLVDTFNMTATLFQAARPPVGFILAGSEGGMQRAVGVSYDWSTETLYRETVLRMPTTVISRMFRIPRAKVGIRRPTKPIQPRLML